VRKQLAYTDNAASTSLIKHRPLEFVARAPAGAQRGVEGRQGPWPLKLSCDFDGGPSWCCREPTRYSLKRSPRPLVNRQAGRGTRAHTWIQHVDRYGVLHIEPV
jgi:hypothetical protein